MTGVGEVLDTLRSLLARELADHAVVLGVAEGGQELRAGWHDDRVGTALCSSVFLEVPEAPRGRVSVVLCRWSDDNETLVYASPQGGVELPRWKRVELVPGGVRLSVQWLREDAPRVYDFHWLPAVVPALRHP